MDIWEVIEQVKSHNGFGSDAALAEALVVDDEAVSSSYISNVRQGIRRFSEAVSRILARLAEDAGVLDGRLESLEFIEACRTMPLGSRCPAPKPRRRKPATAETAA
jgi:hypothetical protein